MLARVVCVANRRRAGDSLDEPLIAAPRVLGGCVVRVVRVVRAVRVMRAVRTMRVVRMVRVVRAVRVLMTAM